MSRGCLPRTIAIELPDFSIELWPSGREEGDRPELRNRQMNDLVLIFIIQ